MAKKNLFLVSYIIDNQPQSTEIEDEAETLTPDEALRRLHGLHASARITDVQVSEIQHPKKPGTTPGHYQQP
jgi:hypothetical protein